MVIRLQMWQKSCNFAVKSEIFMKKELLALSPLIVFIVLYLVTSIIARDFYKVPITVAFMVASIYAVCIFTGRPLKERIQVYSQGAGNSQMMLMMIRRIYPRVFPILRFFFMEPAFFSFIIGTPLHPGQKAACCKLPAI
jgi:hypothetical protein